MVYLVCAIENPTEEESKKGITPKLAGELKAIVATNDNNAAIKYAQEHLASVNMDKTEVLVRPFM